MHHLIVYRRADRSWISVISLESRIGSSSAYLSLRKVVEIFCRDPGFDHLAKIAQGLGNNEACCAHLLNFGFRLSNNHSKSVRWLIAQSVDLSIRRLRRRSRRG